MKAFVFLSVFTFIASLACGFSPPVDKVPVKQAAVGTIQCNMCEMVVKLAEEFADTDSTEDDVKEKVEEFCSSLPISSSGVCFDLVDQYFDELWNKIINDVTPGVICTDLELCSSKKFTKVVSQAPVKRVASSVQCDLCELVVKVVEQYAVENSTEAQVEQQIEDFCKTLPVGSETCLSLVEQYFDEIWQLLIDDEDPDTVCTQIKLCTSKKFTKVASQVPVKQVASSVQCNLCELVVKVVEQYAVENSTEAQVEQQIEDFCEGLQVGSETCLSLVEQYFDEIWQLLIDDEDPDTVCTQIGLCTSKKFTKVASQVPIKQAAVGSTQCDICELLVKIAEQFALENSTEADVEQDIKNFCNTLPSSVSQSCLDLVDQYFDQLWDLIIQDEDPETVCTQIGLCTSKKIAKVSQQEQALCDYCKLITTAAAYFVDLNMTKEEVETSLMLVCSLLPGDFSSECSSVVQGNFPIIYQYIKDEVDNYEICYQIELCTSASRFKKQPKVTKPQDQILCNYCELITTFVAAYVDQNVTEEQIEGALEILCSLLVGDLSEECNDFVEMYLPQIYELVKMEVDTNLICYQLDLCSSTSAFKKQSKVIKPQDDVACELCQLVVNFAKRFVDSKTDEDDVKTALEALCGLLPGNVSSQCLTIVKDDFVVIWDLVKAEVDSGDACILLSYCNKTQAIEAHTEEIKKQEAGVLCVICEYAMKEVESQLPLNATEKDIMNVVMGICNALPSTVKTECTDLINEYGQEIINELINNVAPTAVCAALRLCTIENAAVMDAPVGNSKCSWGPAYWCSSPEAAIECNAKDYCSGHKQL